VDLSPDPESWPDNEEDQIHMKKSILIEASGNGFAEDKELAKNHRTHTIIPTLTAGGTVVLDFRNVNYATQSFIHALIGEALQRFKERALEQLEFKDCSPQLQSLIGLVVDYSLGGFPETTGAAQPLQPSTV
jgi:hypothetical protein